jgi:hypothetical protein
LVAKRLELLRELVPGAARVAVLVNPTASTNAERTLRDVELAARAMGLQIQVLNASTGRCQLSSRIMLRGRRGKFELIERLFSLSVLYINRLLHQAPPSVDRILKGEKPADLRATIRREHTVH